MKIDWDPNLNLGKLQPLHIQHHVSIFCGKSINAVETKKEDKDIVMRKVDKRLWNFDGFGKG